MCGIFGVVNKEINKNKFDSSLNLLSHRGPDNINKSYFFIRKNKKKIKKYIKNFKN